MLLNVTQQVNHLFYLLLNSGIKEKSMCLGTHFWYVANNFA